MCGDLVFVQFDFILCDCWKDRVSCNPTKMLIAELEVKALQLTGLPPHRVLRAPVLLGGVGADMGDNLLAVEVRLIEEGEDLGERLVLQHHHVLREVHGEREEAALRVEPRVGHDLAVVRLQALDDARDAEFKVTLRAVERANDEVDDAEVEGLLVGVLHHHLVLLNLEAPHHLLGAFVEGRHNVRHAEVGEHNSRAVEDLAGVRVDDGLIVADGLRVVRALHEEDVRDVELPRLVLGTEVRRGAEDLLDHRVVLHVPVDLRLRHEDRNILLEALIVLGERHVESLLVEVLLGVLHLLEALPQRVDLLARELVELVEGLRGARLRRERAVEEVVEALALLAEVLIREVRVLSEHVGGQVEQLVLAEVEEDVLERLRGEGRVLQQIVELLEARGGVFCHVHEGAVVQRDGVELLVGARRHVLQRLACRLRLLVHPQDGRLQVEALDERGLLQHRRVADGAHLGAAGADVKLGVLRDALLDDLGDVLEGHVVLLHLIVADGDVVGEVELVPQRVDRLLELGKGRGVVALLVRHAPLQRHHVGVVGVALVEERLRLRRLLLLVGDGGLQFADAEEVVLRLDEARGALGVGVETGLVGRLGKVDAVLLDAGADLRQLLVHARGRVEVGHVVVAVGDQREGGAGAGELLQLLQQNVDDLVVALIADHRVDRSREVAVLDLRLQAAERRAAAHRRHRPV